MEKLDQVDKVVVVSKRECSQEKRKDEWQYDFASKAIAEWPAWKKEFSKVTFSTNR